jgi:exosortase
MSLVLLGILCYTLGLYRQSNLSQNDVFALTTLGMITCWVGGFVTCFGISGTRTVLFPLCFLIFAIPLPEALLARLITVLQYASAKVAYLLLTLTPLPIFRDGLTLTLPDLTIEVADECSSIRSSMALLITCVLASHVLLRRWWSKAVVLLLVYPLAVFKNGVRIAALCLLTIYVDEGFLTGNLHTRGGVVFFGLALIMLIAVLWGLRQLETKWAGTER